MLPPLVLTFPSGDRKAPVLTCSSIVGAVTSVVHLSGELDVESAALVSTVVEDHLRRGVLDLCLDLSGLTFCDVSGLVVLFSARRRLRAVGGGLVLQGSSAFLRQVAGICGWDVLFETGV